VTSKRHANIDNFNSDERKLATQKLQQIETALPYIKTTTPKLDNFSTSLKKLENFLGQ